MTWLEVDPAAEQRYRAVDALAVEAETTPHLVEALRDPSWRVRRLAVGKLARATATPELVSQVLGLLGERGDPGARNAAAAVLAQLGAAVLPALTVRLQHADPDQRKFAADILGVLRLGDALGALIDALADVDANVRVSAAEAIGVIGGPAAGRALDGLLASPDPLLRVAALEGLSRLGAPPPLPRLLPLLDDPLTRPSAFRVLGWVEHPTAAFLMARALASSHTRDAALLAFAVRPLGSELEAVARVVLGGLPDATGWLRAILCAGDAERCRGALRLAAAHGRAELALPVACAAHDAALAELAQDTLLRLGMEGACALLDAGARLLDVPRAGRAAVGEVLLQLAEPALVDRLVALVDLGDSEWAELATRALGRTRARRAVAPLATLLDDDELAVHAYRALVSLSSAWAAEVRAALAAHAEGRLKPHVVRAYAEVFRDDAAGVVQRALHDEREAVRAAAAEAAVAVPAVTASVLRATLMDEAPRVRQAATRALRRALEQAPQLALRLDDLSALVVHALADADVTVLALACHAGALLPALGCGARLRELVSHQDPGVVLSTLEALALRGELSDPTLLEALEHADPEVWKRVFALGAERPAVVERAAQALRHPRWDVRAAAGKLLAASGHAAHVDPLTDAVTHEVDPVAREVLERALHTLTAR